MASAGNRIGVSNGPIEGVEKTNLMDQLEENERKARVDAVWEKMNSGLPAKIIKSSLNKTIPTRTKSKPKTTTPDWMVSLGLAQKKMSSASQAMPKEKLASTQDGANEEGKKLAAAALSAVKDVASAAAAAGRGKVEITEVRDFAGEEIEMKRLVDADSKEATEKARVPGGPSSALDTILEQIKKKPKLSVLDKTKKDWGEFKEEKGLDEELDAYKKSSNKYLDKVSFLQRTDLREFEREKEARLAMQAKRRSEMREDDL